MSKKITQPKNKPNGGGTNHRSGFSNAYENSTTRKNSSQHLTEQSYGKSHNTSNPSESFRQTTFNGYGVNQTIGGQYKNNDRTEIEFHNIAKTEGHRNVDRTGGQYYNTRSGTESYSTIAAAGHQNANSNWGEQYAYSTANGGGGYHSYNRGETYNNTTRGGRDYQFTNKSGGDYYNKEEITQNGNETEKRERTDDGESQKDSTRRVKFAIYSKSTKPLNIFGIQNDWTNGIPMYHNKMNNIWESEWLDVNDQTQYKYGVAAERKFSLNSINPFSSSNPENAEPIWENLRGNRFVQEASLQFSLGCACFFGDSWDEIDEMKNFLGIIQFIFENEQDQDVRFLLLEQLFEPFPKYCLSDSCLLHFEIILSEERDERRLEFLFLAFSVIFALKTTSKIDRLFARSYHIFQTPLPDSLQINFKTLQSRVLSKDKTENLWTDLFNARPNIREEKEFLDNICVTKFHTIEDYERKSQPVVSFLLGYQPAFMEKNGLGSFYLDCLIRMSPQYLGTILSLSQNIALLENFFQEESKFEKLVQSLTASFGNDGTKWRDLLENPKFSKGFYDKILQKYSNNENINVSFLIHVSDLAFRKFNDRSFVKFLEKQLSGTDHYSLLIPLIKKAENTHPDIRRVISDAIIRLSTDFSVEEVVKWLFNSEVPICVRYQVEVDVLNSLLDRSKFFLDKALQSNSIWILLASGTGDQSYKQHIRYEAARQSLKNTAESLENGTIKLVDFQKLLKGTNTQDLVAGFCSLGLNLREMQVRNWEEQITNHNHFMRIVSEVMEAFFFFAVDGKDKIQEFKEYKGNLPEIPIQSIRIDDLRRFQLIPGSESEIETIIRSKLMMNKLINKFELLDNEVFVEGLSTIISQVKLDLTRIASSVFDFSVTLEEWNGLWKKIKNEDIGFEFSFLGSLLGKISTPRDTEDFLSKFKDLNQNSTFIGNAKDLVKVAEILKLESTQNFEKIEEFSKLDNSTAAQEYLLKIKSINQLVKRYDLENRWPVLRELVKGQELFSFLQSASSKDLDALIDSVDEHSDSFIREATVSALLKVSDFMTGGDNLLDQNLSFDEFLERFSNKKIVQEMSGHLKDCIHHLSGLQRLFNNLSKRGEVTRQIIRSAAHESSCYKITVINRGTEILLEYFSQQGRKVILTDAQIQDLKSRALLILTSEKKEEDEKDQYIRLFVERVDGLQDVARTIAQLNEMGHPEFFNISITMTEETQNEIQEKLEMWAESLDSFRGESKYSCFFSSGQLDLLHQFLSNSKLLSKYQKKEAQNLILYACPFIDPSQLNLLTSKGCYAARVNPNENLLLLKDHLDKIFAKQIASTQQKLERRQTIKSNSRPVAGEPFVVGIEKASHMVPALMALASIQGHLPLANQLLFCDSQTKWEDIEIFVERSIRFFNNETIYMIFGLENLSFELQDSLVHLLKNLKKKYLLGMVSVANKQKHLLEQFPPKNLDLTGTAIAIEMVAKDITVVTSDVAGLGKSEYIKSQAFGMRKSLETVFVSGNISSSELIKLMREHSKLEDKALHIVISEVHNPVQLCNSLFQLLITRTIHVSSVGAFLLDKSIPVFIEVSNSYNLADFPLVDWFPNVNLEWNLDELVVSNEPYSSIQMVCKHLYALDNNSIATENIDLNSIISDKDCKQLLDKYFVNNLDNPSYTLLNIFIQVLSDQFLAFSQSTYFDIANRDGIFENETGSRLRSLFLESLGECGRIFAVRSVKSVKESQKRERSTNEIFDRMDSITSWTDLIHSFIVFHRKHRSSFTAVYRTLNEVPESVQNFLKSQSLQSKIRDYQTLPMEELKRILEMICKESDEIIETDSKYALTTDNFLKMILINLRINAKIPVVIMGETGCGKTSLITYLSRLAGSKLQILNIHAGISRDDILFFIQRITLLATSNEEETIWVFLDEINTCNELGIISEMVCNRTLLGKPLPNNMVILAACNPYKKKIRRDKEVHGIEGKRLNDVMSTLVYRVHPLPEAMLDYIWDYGSLNPTDEKQYIRQMIDSNLEFIPEESLKKLILELTCLSQKFIRDLRGSVSLRDVNRCFKLIKWFKDNLQVSPPLTRDRDSTECYSVNFCSMILAFSHCYYCRLASAERREEYKRVISAAIQTVFRNFQPSVFQNILLGEQKSYVERMERPPGIALNTALLENVFVILICILNRLPIFVVGNPGCSKSLSIQLINSNLRGETSPIKFFRKYPQVYICAYQGSEDSTSEGILKTFERAKNYLDLNPVGVIPVVLLDEVGLAEISPSNPLKVLHSLLEGPESGKIAVVGISNWALDDAKNNRATILERPKPDPKDLLETARSIHESERSRSSRAAVPDDILRSLANAYFDYERNQRFTNFHGLRDYYALVKQLARVKGINLTPEQVCHALDRNFNGTIEIEEVKKIFMENMREPYILYKTPVIDLIKENIKDEQARHLMVIGDSSLDLLRWIIEEEEPIIIYGSKLPNDDSEDYAYRALSKIILYMETGKTLILKDLEHIYGSLYDMLNQNYTVVNGRKNCRIALGAHSNPMCYVHDQFKCIILLDHKQVMHENPPFLNRFEKQLLSVEDIMTPFQKEFLTTLKQWVSDISTIQNQPSFTESDIFMGFHEETLSSLVSHCVRTIDTADNAFEQCIQHLLNIASVDGIIRASRSLLQRVYPERFEQLNRDYFRQRKTGFRSFLGSNDWNSSKSDGIVMTYTSIFEVITSQLDEAEHSSTKLGNFNSEKELRGVIRSFWQSKSRVLIIQADAVKDGEHIVMTKNIVDEERTNHQQLKDKRVILLIHIPRKISQDHEEERWRFSFLCGWSIWAIDNLIPVKTPVDQYQNSSLEHVLTGGIISMQELFTSNVQFSLLSIGYHSTDKSIQRHQRLKTFLESPQNQVRKELESRIVEELSKKSDWIVEIALNRKELLLSGGLEKALEEHVQRIVMEPLSKYIFSLESKFSLEMAFELPPPLFNLWRELWRNSRFIDTSMLGTPRRGIESNHMRSVVLPLRFPFSFEIMKIIETNKQFFVDKLRTLELEGDLNNVQQLMKEEERRINNSDSILIKYCEELETHFELYKHDFFLFVERNNPGMNAKILESLSKFFFDCKSATQLHINFWFEESKMIAVANICRYLDLQDDEEVFDVDNPEEYVEKLMDSTLGHPHVANIEDWRKKTLLCLTQTPKIFTKEAPDLIHGLKILESFYSTIVEPFRQFLDSFMHLSKKAFEINEDFLDSIIKVVEEGLRSNSPQQIQAFIKFATNGLYLILGSKQAKEDHFRATLLSTCLQILQSAPQNLIDFNNLLSFLIEPYATEIGTTVLERERTTSTFLNRLEASLREITSPYCVLINDLIQTNVFKGTTNDEDYSIENFQNCCQILRDRRGKTNLQIVGAAAYLREFIEVWASSILESTGEYKRQLLDTTISQSEPFFESLQLLLIKEIRKENTLAETMDLLREYGCTWITSFELEQNHQNVFGYFPLNYLQLEKSAFSAIHELRLQNQEFKIRELFGRLNFDYQIRLDAIGTIYQNLFIRETREEDARIVQVIQNLFPQPSDQYFNLMRHYLNSKLVQSPNNHLTGVLDHLSMVLVSMNENNLLKELLTNPTISSQLFIPSLPSNELEAALQNTQGTTWWQCSCGYLYVIGECGKPMMTFNCPDCKRIIGGTGHNPVPGVSQVNRSNLAPVEIGMIFEPPNSSNDYWNRQLTKTSYRILHFLIYGSLKMSGEHFVGPEQMIQVFKNPQHSDHCKQHIESDWAVLRNLSNMNDENLALFLHKIISQLPTFLQRNQNSPKTAVERSTWEGLFKSFIEPFSARCQDTADTFRRELKDEMNTQSSVFDSKVNETIALDYESFHETLPQLFRVKGSLDMNSLHSALFGNPEIADSHPLLRIFVERYNDLCKLKFLVPILDFSNSLLNDLCNQYKRTAAKEMTFEKYLQMKPLLRSQFELFAEAWTELVGGEELVLRNGCREYFIPHTIELSDSIMYALVEKCEEKSICLALVLEHLAGIQTQFLNSIEEVNDSRISNHLDTDSNGTQFRSISVQSATNSDVVNADADFVDECGTQDLRFGFGKTAFYNWDLIENLLMEDVIRGKTIFDADKLEEITYKDEIFFKQMNILDEISQFVPQQALPHSFRGFQQQSPELVSKLYQSLGIILCFVKKSPEDPSMTIGEYTKRIEGLQKGYISQELGTIQLRHIVGLLEELEERLFDLQFEMIDDKYRKHCFELESFAALIESGITPKNILVALKRMVMRNLLSESLTPSESLSTYLQDFESLWPADSKPKELDIIQVLSKEVRVEHVYSAIKHFMKMLEKESNPQGPNNKNNSNNNNNNQSNNINRNSGGSTKYTKPPVNPNKKLSRLFR